MSYVEKLKAYVSSLPEVTEEPHFHKLSFRINKKIFATYDEHKKLVTVKLSAINQDVFVTMAKNYIYPVPNKWGKQGWTIVEIGEIDPEMMADILKIAYCEVAPAKLVERVNKDNPI